MCFDLQLLLSIGYDLFCHNCHKGHCLSHPYTVKLKPSGAMRLRMRGHSYCQLLSTISTNVTSLFVLFFTIYVILSALPSLCSFFV